MQTSSSSNGGNNSNSGSGGISDVEIVSEEEMAFIEAALASTRSLLASSSAGAAPFSSSRSGFALLSAVSPLRRQAASLHSAGSPSAVTAAALPDIEDSAGSPAPPRSLLQQFRSRRGLMVTDISATEWCEKQMEFVLLHGKPQKTEAMKAGSDRHSELEKEVVEKVEINIKSVEESWAVKFMNFIVGTNQLLFEGLTRELPVIGVVEGIWMIGVIDEIQMPINEAMLNPLLVETKTRYKATLPSEAQKRNARLQIMCYKYLWDSLVADSFPTDHFLSHFELNPQYILSEDVKRYTASLGFHAKVSGPLMKAAKCALYVHCSTYFLLTLIANMTLEDVVTYFRNTCSLLSPSQEQLLLRYELQSDRSLMEEYQFSYDAGWVKSQIQQCLKFWLGEREASYVSKNENWKCRFCSFAAMCPKMVESNSRAS